MIHQCHAILQRATSIVVVFLGVTMPLVTNARSVNLVNPLTGTAQATTPQELVGNIIKALLSVVGAIALLFFIYGGFLWLTSAGEEKKVTQGKNTLMWATIGLAVIFGSYLILSFIINALRGAAGG